MSESQKSSKKNTVRSIFIAIITLFIFRSIKGVWQYSFDMEIFKFYNLSFLAYFLIITILFGNIVSLWAIFKNKIWWFKTFFMVLFLQLIDSLIVLVALLKNPDLFITIFEKSPQADRFNVEMFTKFLTTNHLYLYLFLTLIFFIIMFILTFQKRERVIDK